MFFISNVAMGVGLGWNGMDTSLPMSRDNRNVPINDFNQSENGPHARKDVGTLHFNIAGPSSTHGFIRPFFKKTLLLYFQCVKA